LLRAVALALLPMFNPTGGCPSHMQVCPSCLPSSPSQAASPPPTCVGIHGDGGGQAHTGGAAAGGGDAEGGDVHDGAQQLGLGHTWVSHLREGEERTEERRNAWPASADGNTQHTESLLEQLTFPLPL
jgi:hypothetical protein